MKTKFKNKREFELFIAEHKPVEIWLDSFSKTEPYICQLKYDDGMLQGVYAEGVIVTARLNELENMFKEGMYAKEQSFYTINANEVDLEEIGVSYKITGLKGKLIKRCNSGYYRLKVTHKVGSFEFTNNFDIPSHLLTLTSTENV